MGSSTAAFCAFEWSLAMRLRTAGRIMSRSFAPIVLLFSLLAPSFLAALPLLRDDAPKCGMSCCKRSGVCCCAKRKGPASGTAEWDALPKCGTDCDMPGVMARVVAASLTDASPSADPLVLSAAIRVQIGSLPNDQGAVFALFGRPPPAL
jgi:hypothetical protein